MAKEKEATGSPQQQTLQVQPPVMPPVTDDTGKVAEVPKIKVGETEYTVNDLQDLVSRGTKHVELEKEFTKRSQENAEIKKRIADFEKQDEELKPLKLLNNIVLEHPELKDYFLEAIDKVQQGLPLKETMPDDTPLDPRVAKALKDLQEIKKERMTEAEKKKLQEDQNLTNSLINKVYETGKYDHIKSGNPKVEALFRIGLMQAQEEAEFKNLDVGQNMAFYADAFAGMLKERDEQVIKAYIDSLNKTTSPTPPGGGATSTPPAKPSFTDLMGRKALGIVEQYYGQIEKE